MLEERLQDIKSDEAKHGIESVITALLRVISQNPLTSLVLMFDSVRASLDTYWLDND